MTLPRSGSRVTTVKGRLFRWKPSPMRGCEPPMMGFVCHADTRPSNSVLEVQLWQTHCDIITPDGARVLIEAALQLGWDPASKGRFTISADQAIELWSRDS
jgi:hypothetical protein